MTYRGYREFRRKTTTEQGVASGDHELKTVSLTPPNLHEPLTVKPGFHMVLNVDKKPYQEEQFWRHYHSKRHRHFPITVQLLRILQNIIYMGITALK